METEGIGNRNASASIKYAGLIGLIVNALLFALKLLAGILGRSQALVADAVHSLSDLVTDFAIIVGVKYWSAPADSDHPHGHRRVETIITALIGLILALVAIGLGYKGVKTLTIAEHVQPGTFALVMAITSVIVKEILYRWTLAIGNKVRSSALVANAWHHRSDSLSSIPVVVAITLSNINPALSFVDPIGAIIVSLFILRAAWKISLPAVRELADTGISTEEIEKIKMVAEKVRGVKQVHDIRTRLIGSYIQIDLHIIVDGEISVRKGHDISERVKDKLFANFTNIVDILIHIDPN